MKLADWLDENDVTANELAKKLDCTPCTIFLWKKEKFKPSRHFMKALERITKGNVTFKDFKKEKK